MTSYSDSRIREGAVPNKAVVAEMIIVVIDEDVEDEASNSSRLFRDQCGWQ